MSENMSKKNLKNMLLTVKSIMLTVIMIMIIIYHCEAVQKKEYILSVYYMAFFIIIIAMALIFYKFLNWQIVKYQNAPKVYWIFDVTLYVLSISYIQHIQYTQEFNYAFILLIISSAIQYGKKYGIITAAICSTKILLSDLIVFHITDTENIKFQTDLVVAAVFISISWVLGYYVELTEEDSKKKQNKLDTLSNTLMMRENQKAQMKNILINNEECYDMIFENSVSAILVHDNGQVIYANKSARSLLGCSDCDSMSVYDFYKNEDDLKKVRNKYEHMYDKKLSKLIEKETITNKKGVEIPILNISSYFVYKSKPVILTLISDRYNEKEIEELQKEAIKGKNELAISEEKYVSIRSLFLNLSHELKTPVNVIYSAVQNLAIILTKEYRPDKEKNKKYVSILKQNCLRMTRLINNFIDANKVESGTYTMNLRNEDIVDTIENIVQCVDEYLKYYRINIIFDTNAEEIIMAYDKDLIERIVLNILSNAIKYGNKEQTIMVIVEKNDNEVTLKIKDEGFGIPKEKLNYLFELFGKTNYSLSRECEGVGIGLYITKKFVEMHNGSIKINSEENKGSEVIINLPITYTEENSYSARIISETYKEKVEQEFSDIYSII